MKKTFQQEFLHSLNDSYDFYLNNKMRREELIANFSRLQDSVPFSERLNGWIENWYEQHKDIFVFTDTDDFDYRDLKGNLVRYTERFKATGKIHIWNQSSDNSIFGSAIINNFYRAWHDYVHITYGCGFTLSGEALTAAIQASQLPHEWILEKELLNIDLVGMNLYYYIHKEFVKDQRRFVLDYMRSPAQAIFTKQ